MCIMYFRGYVTEEYLEVPASDFFSIVEVELKTEQAHPGVTELFSLIYVGF